MKKGIENEFSSHVVGGFKIVSATGAVGVRAIGILTEIIPRAKDIERVEIIREHMVIDNIEGDSHPMLMKLRNQGSQFLDTGISGVRI